MSYEILATKNFSQIETYMADRSRLFNTKPKLVQEEVTG
jgi:hypothetical protein